MMKSSIWRQAIPCLAVMLSAAGMSVPQACDANESQFLVNQWIRQSEDGSIQGKLMLPQAGGSALAVQPAVVALMSADNELTSVEADATGAFRFQDVAPGVYTLTTRGTEDAFSIIALHVMAADEQAVELPQEVEVAVGQIDFASLKSMMIRYLPPRLRQAPSGQPLAVNVDALPPMGSEPGAYRIAQTDGGMSGQIFAPGADGDQLNPSSQMNIFVFQNGEEIRRVVSDSSGAFHVESLDPGVYSALVIGASGMGLVGFELVPQWKPRLAAVQSEATLVNVQDSPVASGFVMQVAPGGAVIDSLEGIGPVPGEEVVVVEEVIGEEVVEVGYGAPMGGGGVGGGGGGGGGAPGGRRGGIGLLAIGGLVAGIVALATQDREQPADGTPARL